MRRIPLVNRRGEITAHAKVDSKDFAWLSLYRWRIETKPNRKPSYAVTSYGRRKDGYTYRYMHRMVLGLRAGCKIQSDHINGDGLDNRRKNLRRCTRSENMHNRGKTSINTSGFKGVYWCGHKKRWFAKAQVDKRQHYFGYFDSAKEASVAYASGTKSIMGEFANVG